MIPVESALKEFGAKETIRGKVVTLQTTPVVDNTKSRSAPLTDYVIKVNRVLSDNGLLGKWRAKIGGTTSDLWVLVMGVK